MSGLTRHIRLLSHRNDYLLNQRRAFGKSTTQANTQCFNLSTLPRETARSIEATPIEFGSLPLSRHETLCCSRRTVWLRKYAISSCSRIEVGRTRDCVHTVARPLKMGRLGPPTDNYQQFTARCRYLSILTMTNRLGSVNYNKGRYYRFLAMVHDVGTMEYNL